MRVARLGQAHDEGGVRRPEGASIIFPVTPPWLVEKMGVATRWYKPTMSGPKQADPERKYADTLLARVGEWRFPELQAIISTPTLDRDGRLIQQPGYDAQSGILLYFADGDFPVVPPSPTIEEAEAALERLDQLLRGFPFVDEESRSVALSALLTVLVRPSLAAAPLHAFDAPTAGTGKSLLADLVGILATGQHPPAMSQGKTEEEDEKRLSTVLRAGDPVILIDNCERAIEGDFLCSMLTQLTVQARILGLSQRVILPSKALVIATGNNLVIAGDMARRTVICRLGSKEERPETRSFDFDCRVEARRQRAELVAAGLTVLRGFIAAGRPGKLQPFGSFEDYALIRGALVWLGRADPVATRDRLAEDDPRRGETAELMAAWQEVLGSRKVTLADLHAECEAKTASAPHQRLYTLLKERSRGVWNPRSVGWWLRGQKDRVINGHCFRAMAGKDRQEWWLEGEEEAEVQPRIIEDEELPF